jgi:hypothetical protein
LFSGIVRRKRRKKEEEEGEEEAEEEEEDEDEDEEGGCTFLQEKRIFVVNWSVRKAMSKMEANIRERKR